MARLRLFDTGETEWRIEPETVVVWVIVLLFAPLPQVLLVSLTFALHEAAHLIAAKRLDWSVTEMRLHPMGALMRLFPHGAAAGEGLIVLAGPLANLVTAGGAALTMRVLPSAEPYLKSFLMQNLGMGLWNLLPILPLDGGRTVRVLLEKRFLPQRVRRICAVISVAASVLLLGGCLYCILTERLPRMTVLIPLATALFSSRYLLTEKRAGVASILRHRSYIGCGRALEISPIVLDGAESLKTAATYVRAGTYTVVWVLGERGERIGTLGEEELLALLGRCGQDATLSEAINLQNRYGKFAKSVVY